MLLEEVNVRHEGTYDFFYLPIDFKNHCNVGYCFINFVDPKYIIAFVHDFNGKRWKNFNSEKICAVSFARIQGKQAMIARFQNSSLLEKDDEYRPLLFYSSGPDVGKPEPFPTHKIYSRPQQQQQQQLQAQQLASVTPQLQQQLLQQHLAPLPHNPLSSTATIALQTGDHTPPSVDGHISISSDSSNASTNSPLPKSVSPSIHNDATPTDVMG